MEHVKHLISAIHSTQEWPEDGEKITVSKTSRTAGSAYEKVRRAVEYEEEHLVRRNAIRRILQRRIQGIDQHGISRGELVLRELIWAKYLPNKQVPIEMIDTVEKVIQKYDRLFAVIPQNSDEQNDMEEWLFDVISTEIEYLLHPPKGNEALANFMFDRVRRELVWEAGKIDDKQKDLLIYIAIHRSLLKSNLGSLRYRVMLLYFPHWGKATQAEIDDVAHKLPKIMKAIDGQIQHPLADQLFRYMRRFTFVFWTLHDLIEKHKDFAEVARDDDRLATAVRNVAYARYDRFKKRRTRTVARAVLFLFITKMLLALIIEVPYEFFALQHINQTSLAINILFHPFFLALIGTTLTIPAKRNTAQLLTFVKAVLSGKDQALGVVFKIRKPWTQGALGRFFTTLYLLTYVVSYGFLAWFLAVVLSFNVVSVMLFLLFFSLVTFFGLRIRQSTLELLVVERQGSVFGTLFDFFLLPITRAGRWMTLRASKLNVFAFFLDYVAEAPIKLAIELVEGWIAFVKAQKEEIE
ncbi:hypothetical protein COV06_01250 [Candidatus Uhrbacteria bacterium CG10_big_fil_rev_8_21_14_0_10_50_16]|uniref:Uncharacterized protein n=1 Tax=Candidatus Uhrbacteria bacterium CG10_big_fil_rev_8_21_14_0_10_50_16 TaxID=1975039 RepID=A0A2H0RNC3_9BACT|nr:MAG: hypothetical protein COV06_01250 [Candidatus Uhrbacteria bacterium CG10_big_fil_rev_8_21_14_0_10_50_16]